ncbi:MAG: glycosyltransferase [Thermoanaerobaculia bacterium]
MRILQILLPGSSAYERKSQRVDAAALSGSHEVLTASDLSGIPSADLIHLYAPAQIAGRRLRGLALPCVTNAALTQSRIPWLRASSPVTVISPLPAAGVAVVPEGVEERYFDEPGERSTDGSVGATAPSTVGGSSTEAGRPRVVGSFDRPALRGLVEQTAGRLHRFREDVSWHLFDRDPTPADFDHLDAWVDPATDPFDLDGFVAEALVRGLPVVAARTPINTLRLENGRTGWLVPADDPNELTHAILSALFKPELGQNKISAVKQTRSKFRPRQRLRVLIPLYEALRP